MEQIDLIARGNGGRKDISTRPPLAIVGSSPKGRELVPWDDQRVEIWLFNEAPQKPEKFPRWDASLQLHKPEVYTSPDNWVNKEHWSWLQQDHGSGQHGRKRIFMISADPRVPNAVEYPLEDILSMIPYRYLRSSPAEALALAIYLGYTDIGLYGSELISSTEYAYQANNYAFWIGFAHGRGINLGLHCWESEFLNQPLYGFEGEAQLDKSFFETRFIEHEKAWKNNENALAKLKNRIDQAMLESNFKRVGDLSLELQLAALAAGEAAGAMGQAEDYSQRTNPISRQQFEQTSARAQRDGEKSRESMHHAGGKCEYVWNVWKQTGRLEALNQLRTFLQEKGRFAYDTGAKLGIFHENILYMTEYDKVVTALGGARAVKQITAQGGQG